MRAEAEFAAKLMSTQQRVGQRLEEEHYTGSFAEGDGDEENENDEPPHYLPRACWRPFLLLRLHGAFIFGTTLAHFVVFLSSSSVRSIAPQEEQQRLRGERRDGGCYSSSLLARMVARMIGPAGAARASTDARIACGADLASPRCLGRRPQCRSVEAARRC